MATVSNIIIKITRIHNSDLPVVARSGWILAFIRPIHCNVDAVLLYLLVRSSVLSLFHSIFLLMFNLMLCALLYYTER